MSFSVGDSVRCSNSMVGICRFIGTIHSKPGIWVGIDLAQQPAWQGKGKNDGSVNGVVYFQSQPNCGIFFPISKVSILDDHQPSSPSSLSFPPASSSSSTSPTRTRRQSDFPTTPSSTPRPRPRPSLPARSVIASATAKSTKTRNSSLSSSTSSSSTNTKTLTRTSSFLDQLPPLPSAFNPASPYNSRTNNPFSKSTSGPKRSSVSHLPPLPTTTTTTNRPPSRTSTGFKRPESVNSHHARTATPDWATRSTQPQRRPTSRMSVASSHTTTEDPKSLSSLELRPPPEDHHHYKERIIELERLLELNKQTNQESENQHLIKLKQLESELENIKLDKSTELEKLKEDKTIELEKLKQELNQTHQLELTQLQESLQASQETTSQQSTQFEKERAELQIQIHQLRSAGQSLCGVYEDKISDLEELRLSQLHESELIAQELKATKFTLEELQKSQSNQNEIIKSSSLSRSISSSNHHHRRLEAVEIDNESLKADLKHTQERLSEVQDEAYQLKQELESQKLGHDQLIKENHESIRSHLSNLDSVKEQAALLEKDNADLQFKLNQIEIRFKEINETMEIERLELEALRAEILTAPNNNNNHSSSNSVVQLESQLVDKQTQIDSLQSQLTSFTNHTQSSVSVSDPIMDQEKLLVIQKYQRLLLIKDEENLKLIHQLEALQDLKSATTTTTTTGNGQRNDKIRFSNPSPVGLLRNKNSTQSLRGESSRSIKTSTTTLGQSEDNNNLDLIKANQQIIGLKLIARKSNEDRNKLEKVNLELVNEIEELKLEIKSLEEKLNKLIKFGQFKLNSSSSLSPSSAINNKGRKRSETVGISIGIENEITLSPQDDPIVQHDGDGDGDGEGDSQMKLESGETLVITGDFKKIRKLENCIETLNDKLSNLNSKHSREVEGLNKEVSELESIIENKIFQEEELEERISELTSKLHQLQKTPTATPTTGTMTVRDRSPSTSVGGGADLQRRSSVVWRRRTSETGPHPPSTPVTTTTSFNNSLSPIGLSASPSPIKTFAHNLRFSTGLNGLAESEEDSVQRDSGGLVDRGFSSNEPLLEEDEPEEDHFIPPRNPKRMTRMIVTDHDSGAPHSELDLNDDLNDEEEEEGTVITHHRSSSQLNESDPLSSYTINPASSSDNNQIYDLDLHVELDPQHIEPVNNDGDDDDDDDIEKCELCGKRGHQLDTCPIFSIDS
ncbi:hypothetical protein MJO29_012575 [Puccinia striiformis f. sp. tritici]|nr:hypothetical protein MJO29_012575 [Puccinia striiformis f. sp. tritici]